VYAGQFVYYSLKALLLRLVVYLPSEFRHRDKLLPAIEWWIDGAIQTLQ
jgi:hypothetical protein